MRILIIHQNFPGQFRALAPHLVNRGHEVVAICSHNRPLDTSIEIIRYTPPPDLTVPMNLSQELWFQGLLRASSVALIIQSLLQKGWVPDKILAHSGWGEALALSEVCPDIPLILWPELWLLPEHGGHGTDPELPAADLSHRLNQIGRNCMTRVSLDHASAWILPTQHQANSLPTYFKTSNLHIIHEGIDTTKASPKQDVSIDIKGMILDRSIPVLTFVNRNLERLRGFDFFMRSVPHLQQQFPDLQIIVVGDNEKGYGLPHHSGQPLKDVMLNELSGSLDLSRIHFLGRVPHSFLLNIFKVSRVHVYLSYPFVLGWSLLEAMSCGCAIVGSRGMPVEEVLTHGVNALLTPMDDVSTLTRHISTLLSDSYLRSQLGKFARRSSLRYDVANTMPQLTSLVEKNIYE